MPRLARYKSPEFQAQFLAFLRGGATRMQACASMSPPVSFSTLDGWIERDAAWLSSIERAESIGRERSEREPPKPTAATVRTVDKWERWRDEAAAMAPGMMGNLLRIDAHLSERGFVPMPPWWRYAFAEFYASDKRWFLVRAARGAGKSTMMQCRPCVAECLFGDHSWLGPGEVGTWPLMSVDMVEANGRVGVIVAILEAIGVDFEKRALPLGRTHLRFQDTAGQVVEVRVYPATVTGASGPTLVGFGGDEEAKWKNDYALGTSNARDVLNTVAPAFRAREGTHGFRSSSAWMEHGTHYDDVERGDTDNTHVARIGEPFIAQVKAELNALASKEKNEKDRDALRAYADQLTADSPNIPTWLANPSITPEAARKEANSFDDFMREYVSRSSGAEASSYFDGVKLLEALNMPRPTGQVIARTAAIDPGASSNAFALAIVDTVETSDGKRSYVPSVLKEWTPQPGIPLDVDRETLPAAASIVLGAGCREWTSDAFMSSSFILRSSDAGLSPRFSSPDIHESEYEPARRAIHRGDAPLSGCDASTELRRQLTLVRARAQDGGKVKIEIKEEKGGDARVHGDLGRAYVRALAAAGAGALQTSRGSGLLTVRSRYHGCNGR